MSQYISKNAINNIPLASKELTKDGSVLKSNLLRTSEYLVHLAEGSPSYPSLVKNRSSNEAVRRVKLALNTIDTLKDDFNIGFRLDTTSYEFDQSLEDAVKNFQGFSQLALTGVVNSKTILAIDKALTGNLLFDNEKTKYLGIKTKKTFTFKDGFENGKYTYKASLTETAPNIDVKLDKPLKGQVVKVNNKVYVIPDEKSKQDLFTNNPKLKSQIDYMPLMSDGKKLSVTKIPRLDCLLVENPKIVFKNEITVIEDFELEIENTPPQSFDDSEEKLYKIKSGDKLSNIILDNYYGGGSYIIKNPYDNTDIFTLPERSSLGPALRHEDARFQFYVNLLYYYNSQVTSGSLKEWGIAKKNNYTRYNVDHLDAVNIFDNQFDSSLPQSALPNYYRFLKRMESLNPGSKLTFDPVTGDCTNFNMQVGKNIRIPSRKFADSLYNFLNYRHTEMLREVPDPDSSGDSILDWVADNVIGGIINTMEDAMDSIAGLAQEVKQETIALYNETVAFFKEIYDFAIQTLAQYWPRGGGGHISFGASVIWGIPLKTGIELSKTISRKMTGYDDFIITYSREFTLDFGTEVAVGTNAGFYMGHGKSKKGFGLELGAGGAGGFKGTIGDEYEFPIRKEETALLTMIINVFGGELVKSTADVLEYLEFINLNPRQYLTKMDASLGWYGNTWAAVQTGLKLPDSNIPNDNVQNQDRSFGSVDYILDKLSGLGVAASFDAAAGISFSYEVDYGKNPLVFDSKGGRVFDKIELDIKLDANTQFSTSNFNGNALQKYLGLSLPGSSLLQYLNFDKGLMIGFTQEWERKGPKEVITAQDLKFASENHGGFLTYGKIIFEPTNSRIEKTAKIYLGTYSGDVDSLCETGSEVKINLHAEKLRNMIQQGQSYDFSLENIYDLFDSIGYKKKVGLVREKYNNKKFQIKEKRSDKNATKKTVGAFYLGDSDNFEVSMTTRLLEYSLKNANKKDNLFLSTGIGLSLEMELPLEDLKNAFLFYIKKLYYTYVVLNGNLKKSNKFYKDNRTAIKEFIREEYKNHPEKIEGAKFYQKLFSRVEIKKNDDTDSNQKGLLGVMEDELSQYPSQSNTDRITVINQFIKGIIPINYHLDHKKQLIKQQDYLDYGINSIFQYFSFIATMAQLKIELEAKLGLAFGGHLKAGEGATVGIALNALAELTYEGTLFEHGALFHLLDNDPLKPVFEEIYEILGKVGQKTAMGAKDLFSLLS